MSGATKQKALFLPHLDQDLSPPNPGGTSADWAPHGGGPGVLAKYSDALMVAGRDTPAERLKSIPTPWSRLLIFEQALFTEQHPAHRQVLGEWRGLLAAIALSRYLGLKLEAVPVNLDGARGVVEDLRTMAPVDGDAETWNRLALIQLDGATVGGTSPRTLVFTGIRGMAPSGVPFQRAGRLSDPTSHYHGQGDRPTLQLLEGWLSLVAAELESRGPALERLLGFQPAAPGTEAVSRGAHLRTLLRAWLGETHAALTALGGGTAGEEIAFTSDATLADAFPESHPAHGVFSVLQPVQPPQAGGRRSDLRIREGDRIVNPGATGVLYRGTHPFTGWVNLPAGQNRQVQDGRFQEKVDAAHLGDTAAPDLGALFQSRLIEAVGANTDRVAVLHSGGREYLFPFAPEILRHLDPDLLIASVRATGDVAAGLKVTLEIPVQNGLSVRWERVYFSLDTVDDFTTPDLAVWPDFEWSEWKHYYYFFHQTRVRQNLVPRPVAKVEEEFAHGPDGWGRTGMLPRAWSVAADADTALLLMLPVTTVTTTNGPWDVSIDFGSTHTRVFRATQGLQGQTVPVPVPLKPRTLDLLGQSALLSQDFFIGRRDGVATADEPRSLVRLPLGNAATSSAEWLPSSGIIYWKSIGETGQADGLRANLKWHKQQSEDLPAFHSYISQLYLSVAAEAAAEGSQVSSVITAYPSVFPSHLRNSHEAEWGTLRTRYGVEVKPAIAESSALAAYLVNSRGAAAAANLLAIDVGGSTSDLAVWTKNARASGDSVRLAGDLLTRVIGADPAMQQAVSRAAASQPIASGSLPWRASASSENGLILNDLLRSLTQKFGSTLPLARNLYQGPRSDGERVIAYAGYLYAAVTFLLGMMVRRAKVAQPLYEIFFAGRGSEFLPWLDLIAQDGSTAIPEAFFRAGLAKAGVKAQVRVHPPGATAKHEVGSGLLSLPLDFGTPARERLTFLGESGFVTKDGKPLDWSAELGSESLCALARPDQPVDLAQLQELQRFISAFNDGEGPRTIARALNISPATINLELRNRVHEKLFGPHSAWQACRASDTAADQTLLEPFFIVEAKALLEHVTGRPGLFNA